MNHRVYYKANTFISVKGNVYNNAGKTQEKRRKTK